MMQRCSDALMSTAGLDGVAADYRAIASVLGGYSGRVLDIGGGLGLARQFLPTSAEYVVIDPSSEWLGLPVDRLGDVFPAAKSAPPFVRGVGEHFPFADRSFDAVLTLWTLNHASRPDQVLREACRVLEPGGRLLLVLPDMPPADRDLAASRRPVEGPSPPEDASAGDPAVQADHIAVTEQHLWRWMAGLATPVRREWRGGYLVVEFSRQTPLSPPAAERRPPVGLGDLRRTRPVSTQFGFDRGLPVDRHYIEAFLARNAPAIRGRVLEVGDDAYTWRYGGEAVVTSDVLHISPDNPRATLIGDLAHAPHLPSDRFDCIICAQTLQYVYDVRAALATLCRMLRPGGVLLATAPGISQLGEDEWRDAWCWSFTPLSARRLLSEAFSIGDIEVGSAGNVLAAIAFLQGLAADELSAEELGAYDPSYPLVVTMRAVKHAPSPGGGLP